MLKAQLRDDSSQREGLTFKQWLLSFPGTLPPDFRRWERASSHWNLGHGIIWAVSCFRNRNRVSSSYPWLYTRSR
jgi:hypothetical protein